MSITVRRYGDWDKCRRVLVGLDVRIQREVDKEAKKQAQQLAKAIQQGIRSQSFPMAPLSQDYAEQKAAEGKDGRTLIATGRYVNSIGAWKESEGTWRVGIQDSAMEQLGQWLEYGTRNMPARPHFRVAGELAKRELQAGFQGALRRAVRV